jgi:hypothetical protein
MAFYMRLLENIYLLYISILGPDEAVQQQTNIALGGFDESINSPKISATEAFGAETKSNTQRISPLIKDSNNQNQVSQEKPTLDSEEQSPAMQRLIKVVGL